MTFWPSASQLGRAFACTFPWSGGLRWRRGEESDALRYGNAIHLVGRAHDPAAAKAHIIKRARALMLKSKLPLSWL